MKSWRSLSWMGVLFSGLIALMALMPSCRVRGVVFLFCLPSSTNEGLRVGAEGLVISECCDELLIWKVGEELLSILTETPLPERFLNVIVMLISTNITMSVVPDPIRGHLMLSSRVECSVFIIGFFWTSGRGSIWGAGFFQCEVAFECECEVFHNWVGWGARCGIYWVVHFTGSANNIDVGAKHPSFLWHCGVLRNYDVGGVIAIFLLNSVVFLLYFHPWSVVDDWHHQSF